MKPKHQARGAEQNGRGGAMKPQWKAMGSYGTIGLELVLSIMFGLFAGRWLDGKLDTGPWLALLGFAFGTAAGFRALWRGWKEMQAVTRQEEKEEGNPAPMYPKEDEPDDRPADTEGSEEEAVTGDDGEGEPEKKPPSNGSAQ
jgi:F0F1-type ATP synthase assembly protein I